MLFTILLVLPLLATGHPSTGYYGPPAPRYEQPKHNCSVEDVVEAAEVCTPTLETQCEQAELNVKQIAQGQYCYQVAQTVCQETQETIDNEVCTYTYQSREDPATATSVDVTFERQSTVQMVTVCQPRYDAPYGGYGQQHNYCKEVAQETTYNVPVVVPVEVPVTLVYPEAVKTCVNKPITLPRLQCDVVSEEKCVDQPELEDTTISVEKCVTVQGPPQCQQIELTLPKQVCVELVFGYTQDTQKAQQTPKYGQPAPAPQYNQQPAPAPQYSRPAPAPQYSRPAPAPQYSRPAPPAPAPAPQYNQPAPAPAPAPQYSRPAPPPAPQYSRPAPAPRYHSQG